MIEPIKWKDVFTEFPESSCVVIGINMDVGIIDKAYFNRKKYMNKKTFKHFVWRYNVSVTHWIPFPLFPEIKNQIENIEYES